MMVVVVVVVTVVRATGAAIAEARRTDGRCGSPSDPSAMHVLLVVVGVLILLRR